MTDVPVLAFWSYVHSDDLTDAGRILELADDLLSEFAAITAGSVNLFVDRTSLGWGDDWRARIDEAIAQAAFFIPVITPRYFTSQACRDEILAFAAHAQAAGVPDLVLPVYWIEVRDLESDPSVDEVMTLVAARQRQDLREARLEDRPSSVYRRAINNLAKALADRSERLAPTVDLTDEGDESPRDSGDQGEDEDEGALGLIETLGLGEAALERITSTMNEITAQIESIGELMVEGTAEIERANVRGQGFKARIKVIAKLAEAVREPAERIAHLGQEYAATLMQIDPMVRMLIGLGRRAATAEDRSAAREMFTALRETISASQTAREGLSEMVDASKATAQTSSTMRPVLRELNRGLQGILDSSAVFEEWTRLMPDLDDWDGPPQ